MGKGHLLVLTVATSLVLTPSALAQTTLSAGMNVTPAAGGTPRHPQGHKVTVKAHLATPEGQPRPTVTGIEVWYGRGIEFRRDGVPTCSMRTLAMAGRTRARRRRRSG
jgi:hypothetical protein